jgi:hypothetical protein
MGSLCMTDKHTCNNKKSVQETLSDTRPRKADGGEKGRGAWISSWVNEVRNVHVARSREHKNVYACPGKVIHYLVVCSFWCFCYILIDFTQFIRIQTSFRLITLSPSTGTWRPQVRYPFISTALPSTSSP